MIYTQDEFIAQAKQDFRLYLNTNIFSKNVNFDTNYTYILLQTMEANLKIKKNNIFLSLV